jgi:hypothetical protein
MSTYRTTQECDLTVTGSDKLKFYEPWGLEKDGEDFAIRLLP